MKRVSKARQNILHCRKFLKRKIEDIYSAKSGLIHCSGCRKQGGTIDRGSRLDMDEINGHRTQESRLLGELDPYNIQLLCRICHIKKTDYKQDFRDEELKKVLKAFQFKVLVKLPKLYGSLQWSKQEQMDAVFSACETFRVGFYA